MAFGIKWKTVTTKNAYSLEQLYEAIKDHEFSAGKPEWTKHGMAYIITFPPIDRKNQIWIMPAQMKKECTKWSVQKQELAGAGNFLVNETLDGATKGLFGWTGILGKNAREAERLTEAVAKELDALGL